MSDITCYTILSRDVDLLRWCVSNARERAGIDHDWLLIHWVPAEMDREEEDAVNAAARELGMTVVPIHAAPEASYESRTAFFLHNLYKAWNAGYEHSTTKWVARMGSDQFFSKGWLAQLMRAAEQHGERAIYHCWTVESPVAKHSRHPVLDFGSTPAEFNVREFDQYADWLISQYESRNIMTAGESGLWFMHPSRGMQLRSDGCTWLQTRQLWQEFGPMDDQLNVEGVTGDVAYMDKIYDAGIEGYLIPTSSTYHTVRGESRDVQT